ncbi:MAG: TnsD family transposase [Clostridium sp.]|uniref:TnsD family Tn7-like transposition protein n=1 Tax=Clostridium sp. TaxID=1506 RepID=UPI0025BAD105|nr:TnsD family Tn7-like transposition protein [Clostridium sp.]MCE5221178.1 TnsD family transposase [Clostridium sp.]
MVHFFPLPYPDETLYSVIARYKVWSGNTNSKNVLRELYGKETIVASKHLPSNIKELREHIPNKYKLNEDDLINKTTLYRYYLAFSNNERANLVYGQMIGNGGSKIFATLGLSNNSINNINSLKYCRKCFEEDKEKHGEGYWRREHQLAGVLICGKHKISLYEIDNKYIRNRQEFININHKDLPEKALVDNINEEIIKKQSSLIINSNLILNHHHEYKSMNCFREYYVKRLVEIGIADNKFKINQDTLHNRFVEYYGKNYLELIGGDYKFADSRSWLTKITRKHRTFFHPLYHLLVIDFLKINIQELFNSNEFNIYSNDRTLTEKSEKDKDVYRKRWNLLMINNPNKSKTELRQIDHSTYTWLYKYDKKWLEDNSPSRKKNIGIKNIDWNGRDEEILKKAKVVVEEIINSKDKPERITISLIGRKTGSLYLLQRYISKMPKCNEYIQKNAESVEDFQKRRIEWVKENCFNDEIISEWKVRAKAGIRNNLN